MEERRQALDVTRVRKGQIAARHRDKRDVMLSGQQHGGLTARASQRLQDLYKMRGEAILRCFAPSQQSGSSARI